MQSSLESSGFFETFNSDADDFDLEDDDFPTGTMSFNGRLVISGGPNVFPVLETGGKLLICAQCLYCIRTTIMFFADNYNFLRRIHFKMESNLVVKI